MFESRVAAGVLSLSRPGTRWLSSGWDGGFQRADAAYNVTVPEGFDRRDLAAYARERRAQAGFEAPGPVLFTGVDMRHARGARSGPVEAYATVGLSNPARLPTAGDAPAESDDGTDGDASTDRPPGTVNVVVGTTRALDDGTLAELLSTAVEAKTATLLAATPFSGTTSDAVVVATDPEGSPAAFAGSATEVGAATRVCVREAITASLHSRYGDGGWPESVSEARYGVVTDGRADVFGVDATDPTDQQ